VAAKYHGLTFRVYIPSVGRVGLATQLTLRKFIEGSTHLPVIVCPPSEVNAHRAYWPMVTGCPVNGIGHTRQWILEHSNVDVIIMIDDDMRFIYRPDPYSVKLANVTDIDPMLSLICKCVADGYVHGGVSARQGNNHKDLKSGLTGPDARDGYVKDGYVFVDCDRVNNFHWVNRRRVLKLGACSRQGV
jgi:hypothetical protein